MAAHTKRNTKPVCRLSLMLFNCLCCLRRCAELLFIQADLSCLIFSDASNSSKGVPGWGAIDNQACSAEPGSILFPDPEFFSENGRLPGRYF